MFKTRVVKLFRKTSYQPVPCKTRMGEIMFTRFKLGTTQLKIDLFRVNCATDPYCDNCPNANEDYRHFFS